MKLSRVNSDDRAAAILVVDDHAFNLELDALSVVLLNTLIAPGVTLARRVHAIIRDFPFLCEEVQPGGRLAVSVGVAAFRCQCTEDLIKCSDLALSKALKKGGNAVEVIDTIG